MFRGHDRLVGLDELVLLLDDAILLLNHRVLLSDELSKVANEALLFRQTPVQQFDLRFERTALRCPRRQRPPSLPWWFMSEMTLTVRGVSAVISILLLADIAVIGRLHIILLI